MVSSPVISRMLASRGSRDFAGVSTPFGLIIDDVGLGAGVSALPLTIELAAFSNSLRRDDSATYGRKAASRGNDLSYGHGWYVALTGGEIVE